MKNVEKPLDPVEYRFWWPAEGMTLTIGPDNEEIAVPQILLPLHKKDLEKTSSPSEKAIGEGLYDYLRRFPECPQGGEYAKILQAAYPFYIADLGSEIIILEAKQFDPPHIRQKINMLKILTYLEPDSFGVFQKIGVAYFELALNYTELVNVRRELSASRLWLEKARRLRSDDMENLNYLAQICFFSGAYPQSKLYWKIISDKLDDGPSKTELLKRITRIENNRLPSQPLIERLEAVGIAMEHFNVQEYVEACTIMDCIENDGSLQRELPNPEFFYFLGLCREKCNELSGAFEAFTKTLEIDPQHQACLESITRIQSLDKEL